MLEGKEALSNCNDRVTNKCNSILSRKCDPVERTIQMYDSIVKEKSILINLLDVVDDDNCNDTNVLLKCIRSTFALNDLTTAWIIRSTEGSEKIIDIIQRLISECDKVLTLFNAEEIEKLREN